MVKSGYLYCTGRLFHMAEQYFWALSKSSVNNNLKCEIPWVAVYEPSAVIRAIYFLVGFNHLLSF